MKGHTQLLLAVFVLFCIYQSSAQFSPDDECFEGQMKTNGCHRCICANGHWACIPLMMCSDISIDRRKRDVFGNDCEDGETKMDSDGCNRCFCGNGRWACTMMACSNDYDSFYISKREVSNCKDGDYRRQDCNHCKCISGYWACSRKACPKFKRDVPECEQGQTKMDDCNSCSCAKGLWVCTRKYCLKSKRDVPPKVLADLKNVPCSPSDTFIFDCNRCQCNFERTGYTCVKAQNCTLTT